MSWQLKNRSLLVSAEDHLLLLKEKHPSGEMKCTCRAEFNLDPESVRSREVPGLVDNHNAKDANSLLAENSELEPSAERNQRIMWPATNDKRWRALIVWL